jgi:hypothetical protein
MFLPLTFYSSFNIVVGQNIYNFDKLRNHSIKPIKPTKMKESVKQPVPGIGVEGGLHTIKNEQLLLCR